MSGQRPRVSIGIPIYNGERYLGEALEAVLAQTFEDFELIISDNASTDGTEAICRSYASREPRVRYVRNETNIGAAGNHNRLVALARGDYFKWWSVDDLCTPTYLARCVEALDREPGAVLAYARAQWIGEDGKVLARSERVAQHADWPATPADRFRRLVEEFVDNGGVTGPIYVYGLIRSRALRQTQLIGNYIGADCNLLSELILLGRFVRVPECVLSIRVHPGSSSWQTNLALDKQIQFWDPRIAGRLSTLVLQWRRYFQYAFTIFRSRLRPHEKILLLGSMAGPALSHLRERLAPGTADRRGPWTVPSAPNQGR